MKSKWATKKWIAGLVAGVVLFSTACTPQEKQYLFPLEKKMSKKY